MPGGSGGFWRGTTGAGATGLPQEGDRIECLVRPDYNIAATLNDVYLSRIYFGPDNTQSVGHRGFYLKEGTPPRASPTRDKAACTYTRSFLQDTGSGPVYRIPRNFQRTQSVLHVWHNLSIQKLKIIKITVIRRQNSISIN